MYILFDLVIESFFNLLANIKILIYKNFANDHLLLLTRTKLKYALIYFLINIDMQ